MWFWIVVGIMIVAAGVGIYKFVTFQIQILEWIKEDIEKAKAREIRLNEEAKNHCHETGFYNSNFERCANLGLKP